MREKFSRMGQIEYWHWVSPLKESVYLLVLLPQPQYCGLLGLRMSPPSSTQLPAQSWPQEMPEQVMEWQRKEQLAARLEMVLTLQLCQYWSFSRGISKWGHMRRGCLVLCGLNKPSPGMLLRRPSNFSWMEPKTETSHQPQGDSHRPVSSCRLLHWWLPVCPFGEIVTFC